MFPSLVALGGLVTLVVRREQQFKVEVGGGGCRVWWLGGWQGGWVAGR
jgi:hypothetical protein